MGTLIVSAVPPEHMTGSGWREKGWPRLTAKQAIRFGERPRRPKPPRNTFDPLAVSMHPVPGWHPGLCVAWRRCRHKACRAAR